MGYHATVVADSLSPRGHRLTTIEVCFPRIVLSEFNTHCAISRNSASSRAVPVEKKIKEVLEEPFVPTEFGVNKRGMSAAEVLQAADGSEAQAIWLGARDDAVRRTLELIFGSDEAQAACAGSADLAAAALGLFAGAGKPRLSVHKQLANRLLEPFLWHTVIATATDWSNFFALRSGEGAQPEIATAAQMMKSVMDASAPVPRSPEEWHLPLIQHDEVDDAAADPERWSLISAARCARVSYLTHHGVRDPSADTDLADRLLSDGHMSPFEHVAQCMTDAQYKLQPRLGKLTGWVPLRTTIPNEDDYAKVLQGRSGGPASAI